MAPRRTRESQSDPQPDPSSRPVLDMQTLIVRLGSKDIEVVDLQTQLNVALKRITELEHFIKTATDPKSDQHKPGATA